MNGIGYDETMNVDCMGMVNYLEWDEIVHEKFDEIVKLRW